MVQCPKLMLPMHTVLTVESPEHNAAIFGSYFPLQQSCAAARYACHKTWFSSLCGHHACDHRFMLATWQHHDAGKH